MSNTKQRGLVFLAMGLLSPGLFLVGGGVISSSNGGYWTMIFCVGYVLGLAIAGPWIYWSVKANPGVDKRPPAWAYAIGPLIFALTAPLFFLLFRSEFFWSSELSQRIFMFSMGVCFSFFVPLGVGSLRAHAVQSGSPEPAAKSVSIGKSSPQAK